MAKPDKKGNAEAILSQVQEDEAKAVEKNSKNWLHTNVADNVNKSLRSLNSSDSSDKSSQKSENETTYWDIDFVAETSLLSQPELPGSNTQEANNMPVGRRSSDDYAKPRKPNRGGAGVDNLAFEDPEIPDHRPFVPHDTTRPSAFARLDSIPADYNEDSSEDAFSPPPDYGSSVKPTRNAFAFSSSSVKKKKLLPGSVPVFSSGQDDQDLPLTSLSKPKPASVRFNTSPAYSEPEDDSASSHDPLKITDLSRLSELNLDSITECLQKRFSRNEIYTYCGDILISVNPFKPLDICTSEYHSKYMPGKISAEPHLFAISGKAYATIRAFHHNQVILVSGESGAGKTEATKYMVQHLMSIGGSDYQTLQDKIIKVNPLLEAFGNARTILNNNSSRFAKFLSLSVTEDGKIESARVKDYLLEKSRVVQHSPKERTFHAFYALLAGAPDDLLDSLCIKRHDKFNYISGQTGDHYTLNGRDKELYKTIYQEQQDVFHLLKLTPEEIQDVNSILAAILHLGNIEFQDSDNDSVIITDEAVVQQAAFLLQMDVEKLARMLIERKGRLGKDSLTVDRQVVFPAFSKKSDSGSSLLGTASRGGIYQSLRDFSSSSQKSSDAESEAGEIIELSKNKKQADDERDAIAKALYERMFGWLVRKVNDSLKCSKPSRNTASIGILDICGFENLETNSFEQLCINIINEQLQNFMNKKVIEDERQMYLDENIEIADVDISGINNDAILKMFMDTNGILAMIDEDSKLDFSDDKKMVSKLKTMFGPRKEIFLPSASNKPEFTIVHFAGKVFYNALNFLQKNRDTLSEDTIECLKSSESTLIQDLFTVRESITGSISMSQYNFRGSRKPSIKQRPVMTDTNLSQSINESRRATLKQKFGDKPPGFKSVDKAKRNTHIKFFKNSLEELLDSMKQAEPYFVRCIKPNEKQRPNDFVEEQVKTQLKYNGVQEAARIKTVGFGFPVRLPKRELEHKFKDLVKNPSGAPLTNDIFETVGAAAGTFKVGKTQVFMKKEVKTALEKALSDLRDLEERERQRQEELMRLEKELQLKAQREQLTKNFMSAGDSVNGKHRLLDTIAEVVTPASQVNDGDYNVSKRSSASSSGHNFTNRYVVDDDDDDDDSDSQTFPKFFDETDEAPKVKTNPAWDISQELTVEEEKKDVHEQPVLMVIKFIVYLLLLVLIFGSLICQKISLMVSIKSIYYPGNSKSVAVLYLVIAMCIPVGLWWIITVLKLCFGNYQAPSLWTWIWVFIMENLQTVGMCLLVFRVLPQLDVIRGLMLLSGVALVPSVLKLTMSDGAQQATQVTCIELDSRSPARKVIRFFLDAISMCLQLSVIPLCILLNFQSIGLGLGDISENPRRIVETVFAIVLVSCGHWENFVDGRFLCDLAYSNWFKNAVLKMRFELQKGRHYPHLAALLFKIGITIWLGYQLTGADVDYINAFREIQNKRVFYIKDVSAVITLCIAPFVAFYLAFGACMFQMQIPSLTFPLILASPAAIGVFALNSKYNFLNTVTDIAWSLKFKNKDNLDQFTSLLPVFTDERYWYHMLFGIGWWFSLLILTRHIWRPQKDRTANMERLFINPSFCGILTTENIMLNRRRHPLKVEKIVKLDDSGEIIGKFYKLQNMKRKKDFDENEELGSDLYESENASNETVESGIPDSDPGNSAKEERSPTVPMLYACATMWHETRTEMVQLLKSLHRLDRDQYIRRLANERVTGFDPDFYNFEAHIFFDDAMELDDNDERVPNRWVKDLVSCMDVACSSVHGKPMKVHAPMKVPTPYGGQLIWQMPGENLLFVHMKDVTKIRNRKRWSQVMYMYYLLGYRHIMTCKNDLLEKMRNIDAGRGGFGLNIHEINYLLGENAAARSQNTYLLALDGDTDFSPGSVKILLDRMRDENVGAACGRIHPIGNGPMIWYQKFEYAIGHWLQKAAEHVFGCVLCSPGCFSLFRAAALMDTNVMKKYTTEPTEPSHHLQFDQGEDRWLCTLLLQQGYRIEYAAAADAWTFAPEGFFEFFNQRRRWMPSTIANILDLLGTASLTTKKNASMSILYIGYQWLLMLMTILGPGTILMMIAGASKLVFEMTNVDAYLFATIPAAIFTISCFWLQSKYQLIFAGMLSIMYTFIMMIVFVGTIITVSTNDVFHPSVIVIVLLSGIFIIAGFCHPQEIWCLVHGILYLLTIPSGYLLLVIYSICNLNDVSWGTREVPTKAQRLEMEQKKKEKEEQKKNKQKKGFLARIFNRGEEHLKELTNLVKTLIPERGNQPQLGIAVDGEDGKSVVELLSKIESNLKVLIEKSEPQAEKKTAADATELTSVVVVQPVSKPPVTVEPVKVVEEKPAETKPTQPLRPILKHTEKRKKKRDELRNPFWSQDKGLGNGVVVIANAKELQFWEDFVTKYLLPIRPTAEEKKKIADGLKDLRNSSAFALIIINLLWMALNFMFQEKQVARITFNYNINGKKEFQESILGIAFVALLLILLILQMIGMLIHRMGTLQHLLAITEIKLRKGKESGSSNEKRERDDVIRHIKEVLKIPSAYDDGKETLPPQLAEQDNHLGVSVIGGSQGRSLHRDQSLTEELSKTVRTMGPIFDAQRMSGNNKLNRDAIQTLNSVRQRLFSGTIHKRLEEIQHGLSKSLRPELPPRNKRATPALMQTTSNWGFTMDELSRNNLLGVSVSPTSAPAPTNFSRMGAMGRSLMQKSRLINEVTSETLSRPGRSIKWSGSDVADRSRPSVRRFHRASHRGANHINVDISEQRL